MALTFNLILPWPGAYVIEAWLNEGELDGERKQVTWYADAVGVTQTQAWVKG